MLSGGLKDRDWLKPEWLRSLETSSTKSQPRKGAPVLSARAGTRGSGTTLRHNLNALLLLRLGFVLRLGGKLQDGCELTFRNEGEQRRIAVHLHVPTWFKDLPQRVVPTPESVLPDDTVPTQTSPTVEQPRALAATPPRIAVQPLATQPLKRFLGAKRVGPRGME
jgi:hypothetical protein